MPPACGAEDCGGDVLLPRSAAGVFWITRAAGCAPCVYAARRMAVAAGGEEALPEEKSWLAANRKPAGSQQRGRREEMPAPGPRTASLLRGGGVFLEERGT